jgi:transcriptional regulator with XRE-family HTH domain
MDFSDRLHHALTSSSISQSELARRLNVRPQSVQQWLSGKNFPRHPRIAQIAEALSVAESWLATGIGPTTSNELVDHWERKDRENKNQPPSLPVRSWFELIPNEDRFNLAESERRYIDRPCSCSNQAYALQVSDSSMSPDFSESEFIILEPCTQLQTALAQSKPCFAIVLHKDQRAPILRKLIDLDGDYFLVTSDSSRPDCLIRYDEQWQVLASVVGKIEFFHAPFSP